MHTITSQKLHVKGLGRQQEGAHIVIKTHDWSDEWDPSSADCILSTWRDSCGVVNSYLRIGWLPHNLTYLKSRMAEWIHDYKQWQRVSHQEFLFPDLSDVNGRELTCLESLSVRLGLPPVIDSRVVSARIQGLPVPKHGLFFPWSPGCCNVAMGVHIYAKLLDCCCRCSSSSHQIVAEAYSLSSPGHLAPKQLSF